MRLLIDYERCIASGACVTACPEVFGQDEDGIVTLLDPNPGEELRDKVEAALAVCPAACLEVGDG